MGELLRKSLSASPVIKIGDYEYFVHPATDGVPEVSTELLTEICDEICSRIDFSNIDKIVVPEAMGIPIGTVLSVRKKLPLNIIRKMQYGLDGELKIQQRTGYSGGFMYINGVKRGDRILLVDDVVSTGGTITSIVRGLQNLGAKVVDIVVIIEKGEAKAKIEKALKRKIKSMIKVEIVNGKVSIVT